MERGFPPDILGRIFDPFFTTKDVGKGTGLGLDIVRRILRRHSGEVDVSSRPGHTEFRVSLPAAPSYRMGQPKVDLADRDALYRAMESE
jgi:signal transduction histidine kinase